jgi:hypothetical protein
MHASLRMVTSGFAGNHPSMGTFASIATKLKTLLLSRESTYRPETQGAMVPLANSEVKRGPEFIAVSAFRSCYRNPRRILDGDELVCARIAV